MSHLPVALSLAPVELRGRSSASLSRGLRKQGTNGTSTTGRNTGAGLCLVCALGRVLFHFLRWPTRTTWIVHLLFLFLKKTPVHHAFVRHDETAVTTTRGSSTSREEDRDVDIKEEALVVLAPNQDQQVQELDGTEIKNFAGGHHAPTVDAKDHSRSRQLGSTSSGSSFILTTMEVKPAGAAPAGDEQDEQGGLFDELLRPADEDVLHPQGGLQVKAEISTGKNKKPATQTNLRGRRSQRRVSSRAKAPAKSADMAVSASSGSTSGSTRTEPPSADLGAKSEKQEEEISSSGVLSLLPSWMVNLPDTLRDTTDSVRKTTDSVRRTARYLFYGEHETNYLKLWRPLKVMGWRGNELRVRIKDGDLLACQCVLLNVTQNKPLTEDFSAKQNEINSSPAKEPPFSSSSVSVRDGATSNEFLLQNATENYNITGKNFTEYLTWFEELFSFLNVTRESARYRGYRYYVPWNSLWDLRRGVQKSPKLRLFWRNAAYHLDYLDLLPWMERIQAATSDHSDADDDELLSPPLDANVDLRDFDPTDGASTLPSDDAQDENLDPYITRYDSEAGPGPTALLREMTRSSTPAADPLELVDWFVSKPRDEKAAFPSTLLWHHDIEPSLPEDKWAFYVVPRYLRSQCDASCSVHFFDSDSHGMEELRKLPQQATDEHQTAAAMAELIHPVLVRYKLDGPESVKRVPFLSHSA